jgi:hypothetical protein
VVVVVVEVAVAVEAEAVLDLREGSLEISRHQSSRRRGEA